MSGKCPDNRADSFAADTFLLSTRELSQKYNIALSTTREWRLDIRHRLGLEVGYGTGEAGITVPMVEGLVPDENPERLWQKAFEAQARTEVLAIARDKRRVILPNEPCAIATLSDIHLGSPETDYRAARSDAEIVRDTPGMYAIFNGDGPNNWIVEKLQHLQRKEVLTFGEEITLFADWLGILGEKLKVVVSGNHDNWTERLAGIDLISALLRGARVLVDNSEVVFDLVVGPMTWTVKSRHKWRGQSVFNPTHGQEVGWERGDDDYDIALGGHTHIGTLCRPFFRHKQKRHAVLTGTYLVGDRYGRELGLASSRGRGSGALLLHPDGRTVFLEDLETAAEFLQFWRE